MDSDSEYLTSKLSGLDLVQYSGLEMLRSLLVLAGSLTLLGRTSGSPLFSSAIPSSNFFPGKANDQTQKSPPSFAFQSPLVLPALFTPRSVCHGGPVLASRKSFHSVGDLSAKKIRNLAKTYIRMESTGGSAGGGSDDVPPLDARFDGWVEKSSDKAEMLEVGHNVM